MDFSQIKQKLKNIYFSFEDKYYALLDRINEKIPIYKVIDPIDKVFPSMLLWPILIIAILSVFFLTQAPLLGAIKVLSFDKNALIDGASVIVQLDGKEFKLTTDEFGTARFELGANEKEANVTVEKSGFEKFSKSLLVKASEITEIRMLTLKPIFKGKKKIIIVDSETEERIEAKATVGFGCSTNASPPPDLTTSTGELEVGYTEACGTVYASVSVPGYSRKANVALSQETNYVKMSKLDANGRITVSVEDESGNSLKDVQLRLLDEDGTKRDETTSDRSGTAAFRNVKPGTYSITAMHLDGRFKKEEKIQVAASAVVNVKITLPNAMEGKNILLKIIDSETREPINNAEITIFVEKTFMLQTYSDVDGKFKKTVADGNNYWVSVWHPSYVAKIVAIELKEQADHNAQIVVLEKTKSDGSNFGSAVVNVIDYDSKKPVEEAEVLLFNIDYNWIPMRYPSKLTNGDGNAIFPNLPAATYFAKAKKADSEGSSVEKQLDLGQTILLDVVLVLENGDFEVSVLDYNGTALSDANVSFIDAISGTVLDSGTTDASGKIKSKPIKSDKVVFLKAIKQGFLPFKSIARQVIPKATQKVEVRLIDANSVALEKDIALRFKGFFKDAELAKKETVLKSERNGTTYYLRFEVILTKSSAYSEIKKHYRVGKNEQRVLPDQNYSIKLLNTDASPVNNTILSNCFNPNDAFSNPGDCINTTKGAKQSNVYWLDSESPAVLEEIATVFIEPNLPKGREVRFYYKARAKINGTGFETDEFVKSYKIGDRICEDDCPTFLWELTLQQQGSEPEILNNFSRNEEKEVLINTDFNLNYSIINTKNTDFNSLLTIENKNPGEVFSFASLGAGAGAKTLEEFMFNAMTEKVSVGPIQMRSVNEAKFTEIEMKLDTIPLVQDNNITMYFAVTADGNLLALGLPKNLDPRIPNQEVSAQIVDKNSLLPAPNAVFRVFKDRGMQPIGTGFSDINGNFKYVIEMPAINSVTLVFEKPGYRTLRITIPVVDTSYDPNFECVTVDRQSISMALKQSESFKVITTNCNEKVDVRLSTELKASPETLSLDQNDEMAVTITADKKNAAASEIYSGEYIIYVKARFASDVRFLNARKVAVSVADPSTCFSISKTTFNFSSQQTDSATITNACPTTLKSVFRPRLEIDSHKVLLEYNPHNLPESASFHWKMRMVGIERYLVDVNREITDWERTPINTGTARDTNFLGVVTTQISDANGAIRARFESWYPESCVPESELAFIAEPTITINTNIGSYQASVPCSATGCVWTENSCKTTPGECRNLMSKCQYAFFEFSINPSQKIQSITAKINNPKNTSSVFYSLFATRIKKQIREFREQTIETSGSLRSSTIGTEENKTYYLGENDLNLSNLENSTAFKQGYFRNVDLFVENDSNGIVETWLQGDSIFAKYIGKPAELGPNINFVLRNLSVNTVDYATITVQDYTSEAR